MASKKDLYDLVNKLNKKYCKNTKNELTVNEAYGGYCVGLTGKKYKRGKKIFSRKGSLGSGFGNIGSQDYHDTATNTIASLYKADFRGWIKNQIRYYEKH